jgi:gas vesicle protein
MGQSTTEVRQDIERTRDEMSGTIDAIADRTSPSRVVGRQRRRMLERVRSLRDQVMGSADQLTTSAHDTLQSGRESTQHGMEQVGERARELPDQARQQVSSQTQGNPLAAGLVAFGGGLLAAYLIPSSRPERQATSQIRDSAAPALDEVKEAGRDVVDEIKTSAQQAAEEVKETVSDSA